MVNTRGSSVAPVYVGSKLSHCCFTKEGKEATPTGTALSSPRHQPIIPRAEHSPTYFSCHQTAFPATTRSAHRGAVRGRGQLAEVFVFRGLTAQLCSTLGARCLLLRVLPQCSQSPHQPSRAATSLQEHKAHSTAAKQSYALISVPKSVHCTPAAVLCKFKLEEHSALLLEITW